MGLRRPDQVALKWHDGRARIWVHGYTLEHAAQKFFGKYAQTPGAWSYVYVQEGGVKTGHITLENLRKLIGTGVNDLQMTSNAIFPPRYSRPLIVSRRMKEVIDSWGS